MQYNVFILSVFVWVASIIQIGSAQPITDLEAIRLSVPTGNIENVVQVNSESDDFAPCLFGDETELIITSNRRKTNDAPLLDSLYKYGEAIYRSYRDGQNWTLPGVTSSREMSLVNTGTMIGRSGNTVAQYTGTYQANGGGGADIMTANSSAGAFSDYRAVYGVNSQWWDSQPAISADGSILVFASDRRAAPPPPYFEGRLSTDLWMVSLDNNGVWSPPVMLPEIVNTDYDEISPHFGSDGYMYFASNRPDGSGGFDIYRCKIMSSGVESGIELMPDPVNSVYDDCFPWQSADRQSMYFASNRPEGKGGYDIWKARCYHSVILHVVVKSKIGPETYEPVPDALIQAGTLKLKTNSIGEAYSEISPCTEHVITVMPGPCYSILSARESILSAQISSSQQVKVRRDTEQTVSIKSYETTNLRDTIELEFILSKKQPRVVAYNDEIEYFVTGYWKPNTTENYEKLIQRVNTPDFANVNYVRLVENDVRTGQQIDYRSHAKVIDKNVKDICDSIRAIISDNFNPCYSRENPLIVSVLGYVDDRGLEWGIYPDDTVTTENVHIPADALKERRAIDLKGQTIATNDVMAEQYGNRRLSHLRAYFTYKLLDSMLSTNAKYLELRNTGQVVWKYCGGYIPDETPYIPGADPLKRKFRIIIQ